LTSNLSAYLPLTGGTLTGALSGTSAYFSDNLGLGTSSPVGQASNNRVLQIVGAGTGIRAQIKLTNSVSGATGTDGLMLSYDDQLDGYLYNFENGGLLFGTNNAVRLTIASTGAATFSSSVTSTVVKLSDSTLSGAGNFEFTSEAFFGARFQSNAYKFMAGNNSTEYMRITSGGNVGIGTSSPNNYGSSFTNLQVNGTTNGLVQVSGSSSTLASFYAGNGQGQIGMTSNHPFVLFTNDTERMRITGVGAVSINAPTTATDALNIQGATNYNTVVIAGSATSSQSYGLFIKAGTNSSDYSLLVRNQAASTDYFKII